MAHSDSSEAGLDPRPSDLEYDLAHEGEQAARLAAYSPPEKDVVQLPAMSADPDCDYGYDLAHDVPGR